MGNAVSKAQCEVHGDRVAVQHGLQCRRRHFVCRECLSRYILETWQPAQRNLSVAQPEVRCLVPGCDSLPFNPTDVVRQTSTEAGATYLRIRQQADTARTLAEAQQVVAEAMRGGDGAAEQKAQSTLLSLQLVNDMPHALMCPKCGFGPVDHFGCDNLRNPAARNSCPRCNFRGATKAEWLKWDGKVAAPSEQTPSATAAMNAASQQQRKRSQTGPIGSSGESTPSLAMLRRDRSESAATLSVHRASSLTASSLRTHADPTLGQQDYRARVLWYLTTYHPEKAATVDVLLSRYRGREEDIMQALRDKYGPEPASASLQTRGGVETGSDTASTIGAPAYTIPGSTGATPLWPAAPDASSPPRPPRAAAAPPTKYVKGADGVRRLNPDYLEYTASKKRIQGNTDDSAFRGGTTLLCPQQALPVVCSMEEHDAHFPDTPLAEKTDQAISDLQAPDGIPLSVGVMSDQLVDELGRVFCKYEAPIGLVPKLLRLQGFDGLEFIVDDSGSMALGSDTVDRSGKTLTRWQEVEQRMTEIVEILSYIPTGFIRLRFLNRTDVVVLRDQATGSEHPQAFVLRATNLLHGVFQRGPAGGTPALQAIRRSLQSGNAGSRVARYLFGDGRPNGGIVDQRAITQLLTTRPNPAANPFTFISCTNDGAQTEWMKDCEEAAPYCAEYDDFQSEAVEVRKDHGAALPYTIGIHLIAQLVGAMSPEDLDALDESVPLTKYALDNLLGLVHTQEEYLHYFNCFEIAKQRRPGQTAADEVRRNAQWRNHLSEFVRQPASTTIPVVAQFKKRLAAAILL